MLYTPAMLLGWLNSCVLYSIIGKESPVCNGGIVLLNDYHDVLSPNCLYLGDVDSISHALTNMIFSDESYIFICAGSTKTLEEMILPDKVTLLTTSLDLLSLYNKVHYHVHKFLSWDHDLENAVFANDGYQNILDIAYSGMRSTIVLLNTGYKVLAACYEPGLHTPLTDELQENSYLSFESVNNLIQDIASSQSELDEHGYIELIDKKSGLNMILWPINYKKTVVGRLVVVTNSNSSSPNYVDVCHILIHYLKKYMLSGRSASYEGNAAFGSLVADLIEYRLNDPLELKERIKQVPLVIKSYYHLLIVSFPDGFDSAFYNQPITAFNRDNPISSHANIPWNYVVSQLQEIFPISNISIYHNEILLLVRKEALSPKLVVNEAAITKILNYYNGYMSVGNFSKFLTSLAPLYYQTKETVRLGVTMPHNPGQRVFYYEDYAIYHDIELATIGLKDAYGISNFVYLCHPALISLLRYDRKHSSNLCNVLQIYLTTDRNAAEAARILYLHRNTMLYKISKIEEIIGQSLDDAMLRLRLLYSYHVLKYVTDYLKVDILELKPERPEAVHSTQ